MARLKVEGHTSLFRDTVSNAVVKPFLVVLEKSPPKSSLSA